MAQEQNKDLPVYLFTGFLESGKTKFIRDTLADPKFNEGEKTLLILCEEGLEEYDEDESYMQSVTISTFESADELTEDRLRARAVRAGAERVIIEYNGMWALNDLFMAIPAEWTIYQLMFFADASTIMNYNANMRQLVAEKIQTCDMVIFNRVSPDTDKDALHKLVRGLNRSATIIYEHRDGAIEYDEIEDPLPFDINADIVSVEDRDYALFYRDLTEDMEKYEGKTVRFKGLIARDARMPKNLFVAGRHIMTCCEADIAYSGLACVYKDASLLNNYDWRLITAKIALEKSAVYKKKGPVLYVTALEACEKPEQEVATFY